MRIRAPLATYALFLISKIAPATARITAGKGQRRQIDNCHGICCRKTRYQKLDKSDPGFINE